MKATCTRLISAQVIFILGFSIAAIPQGATLAVSGTVKDDAGKPVPNAKISQSVETGKIAETQTDIEGNYQFERIARGQYEVSATAEGFRAKTASISVSAASQTADIALTASNGPSLSDLGFNTAGTQSNPQQPARLDRRTRMLKTHQKMGLITAGPLAATIITGFGDGGRKTSSGTRDFHAALGSATAGLYFTTAYFAIRAPRIAGTHTRGPIRVRETLAWIHGPG